MALYRISKQQAIRLLVVLLSATLTTPMVAQVTRKKMLVSFHKATTYNNAGNPDKAIATLREIAELAPMYPDTYLRMAEIYDQAGNKESAIVMYRKYINLEMDDAKIAKPSARLKALESELGMAHYEDTEEKIALQLFSAAQQVEPSKPNKPAQTSATHRTSEPSTSGGGLQLFAVESEG